MVRLSAPDCANAAGLSITHTKAVIILHFFIIVFLHNHFKFVKLYFEFITSLLL